MFVEDNAGTVKYKAVISPLFPQVGWRYPLFREALLHRISLRRGIFGVPATTKKGCVARLGAGIVARMIGKSIYLIVCSILA